MYQSTVPYLVRVTGLSHCTSASAIQQKGHSHFGAMANFKEICGAILRVCYPYQKKRMRVPPFVGNRTFTTAQAPPLFSKRA